MKFTLPHLKIGDLVEAEVVESLESGDLIVNFAGDLVRVGNKSDLRFVSGQVVNLQVIQLRPLSFQVSESRRRRNLNVSV